jgi:hypothetical protein
MQLTNTPPQALTPVFQTIARMQRLAKRGVDTLEETTKATFDCIWHNPDATPAEMLAGMGTKAVENFTRHHAAVLALRAAGKDTSAYDTPPLAYTAHDDGTITLH